MCVCARARAGGVARRLVEQCKALEQAETAAPAARALARVAGWRARADRIFGSPHSYGYALLAPLDESPRALALIVSALDKALEDPALTDDLAFVIAALHTARGEGHHLLVDAGTVPALLRHLPHHASMGVAIACECISSCNEEGRDALCTNNAAPLLLAAAMGTDDATAAMAFAMSLGNLAAHPDARAALATLAERAASDERALQLLGAAICNTRLAFVATEQSAMRLLHTATAAAGADGGMTLGALTLVYAVVRQCSPDQKHRLMTGEAFDALVSSAEHDSTGFAWAALASLADTDAGRERARKLGLPRRLPAALANNVKVAYQALGMVDALSVHGTRSAAALVEGDEIIASLGRLIATSDDFGARFLANRAAGSLERMVASVPAGYEQTPLAERSLEASAAGVLQRAANAALQPALELLSGPPTSDATTWSLSSLVGVIAKSEAGCALARGALAEVLQAPKEDDAPTGAQQLEQARLLSTHLLSPCYDNGVREPSRDLGVELLTALNDEGRDAEGRMALLKVLHALPDRQAVLRAAMQVASTVPTLVTLLGAEEVGVAFGVLRILHAIAKQPMGYAALVQAGALAQLVALLNASYSPAILNARDVLSAVLTAADSAGGDERQRVADAIVKLDAVPMLEAQIRDDPLLQRPATSGCCTLLTHLARTDAGRRTLKALVDARAVSAVRTVVSTSHARAAAIGCGLIAALGRWLETMGGRPATEREATLGLVSALAAARDVSTETHILPLVPRLVALLRAVAEGGAARDASSVAAMRLISSLSGQQAGLRAVHAAGVLPLLLPLMRVGVAAGEGAYATAGVQLIKRALADGETKAAAVAAVEAVVGLLPADERFDAFAAADARLAADTLRELIQSQPTVICEAGAIPRLLAASRGSDVFALARRLPQLALDALSHLLQRHASSLESHGRGVLDLLVRSCEVASTPHDGRRALLKALLPGASDSVRHGAIDACLGVLALANPPAEVQDAAAKRLLDEPENALREEALLRWCGTLEVRDGDAALRAARVLARDGASALDATPRALARVVRALGEAPASVGGDLAEVVRAMAAAREGSEGYRLLLDAGAVPALLRQLPHEAACVKAASAIAQLAQNDDGQDALIQSRAAPQLLEAALKLPEDAAAADAARALARLAVHPDGREQLSKLAERAASDERAMRLLAIAIGTCKVGARAVAQPAMRLLEPMLSSSAPPASPALLRLLHAVVVRGSREQRCRLAEGANFDALVRAVEQDGHGLLALEALY